MMQRVLQSYSELNERERRMVTIGLIAAVLILIFGVLLPLQRRVTAGEAHIQHMRSDLSWLRSVSPQLGAMRATAPAPLHESLVALVDRTAREAGIGKSLVGSQPGGNGALSVRFEQAPFDSLISWLSQLGERYGVRTDSANIDAGRTLGTVNATLVLRTH
jgi:type II secretory pathway component PulM